MNQKKKEMKISERENSLVERTHIHDIVYKTLNIFEVGIVIFKILNPRMMLGRFDCHALYKISTNKILLNNYLQLYVSCVENNKENNHIISYSKCLQ